MNYDIDNFDWARLHDYCDEYVMLPCPLADAITRLLRGRRLPTIRHVRYDGTPAPQAEE